MKFAWRSLAKRPALTLASGAVLAAALAFNISAFSVINTLLFRPYPYPQLPRLMGVLDRRPAEGAHQGNPIAAADFIDLRRANKTFDDLAAYRSQALVLSGSGEPERIEGIAATANFFDVLGARTVAGRTFASDEDVAGRDDRVILSHRYWKNRLGADPTLVGRPITLNDRAMTVIGVIGDDNCYPPGIDAWVPLVLTPAEQKERVSQRVLAIGRLKAGVAVATAREDVTRIASDLAVEYPATNEHRSLTIEELLKEQYEFTAPLFLMVQLAAVLVLLLGAANVVNLLLAETVDREQEFAVRLALGASRSRVFRQMLAEATTLALVAGAAAVMLASWSMPVIRALLPEGIARWIAGWQSIAIDGRVVSAAAALTLLTGAGLGCATGSHALRSATVTTLRDPGRSGLARLTFLRRVLIVGEVAFALVLLLAAGVTLNGFRHLSAVFDQLAPQNALRFRVALPQARYPDATRVLDFQQRLLEAIAALPAVTSVGMISNEPASNVPSPLTSFVIEGRGPLTATDAPRADLQAISPGGFSTLRLRARVGRVFTTSDGITSPRVAVVSDELARRFWPDADPIGTRIRIGDPGAAWTTIVGVVTDMRLNWYDGGARPTIYLPHTQTLSPQMYFIVRATGGPATLAAPIRAIGQRLDPIQPLGEMQTMDEVIRESVSPIRVLGMLLLVAGALALVFAATGIYGVLAHWVRSRWREFGIRIALGASAAQVRRLVFRQALTLVLVGLAIGVPCGLAALALLQARLFGVTAADPSTVCTVTAFVLGVAAAAAFGPARRAFRTDTAILLRSE